MKLKADKWKNYLKIIILDVITKWISYYILFLKNYYDWQIYSTTGQSQHRFNKRDLLPSNLNYACCKILIFFKFFSRLWQDHRMAHTIVRRWFSNRERLCLSTKISHDPLTTTSSFDERTGPLHRQRSFGHSFRLSTWCWWAVCPFFPFRITLRVHNPSACRYEQVSRGR